MRRHYFVRDRRIEVEQLDDVVAVHVDPTTTRDADGVASSLGADVDAGALRNLNADISDEAITAFRGANWRFVQPNNDTRRAVDAGEQPPDTAEVGWLVQRTDGSAGIATKRLNVQLDPQLPQEEAEAEVDRSGLRIVNRLNFAPNLYEVEADGWPDALSASVDLHDNPRFVFAEPSLIEHIPPRLVPTDPRYGQQWQWNNTGANGGVVGADVDAEDAWDRTLGADIRVAVIDNGFDADHEDLAAGVTANSGFYTGTGFTVGIAGMPDSNHGTFCAGMVGARSGNGVGGTGAAPQCELMLIACLGDQVGTQTTLARAIAYAANPTTETAGANPNDGADIIVSSLGPNGAVWNLTATLDLALQNAAANGRQGRGVAIFWAASNGANVDVLLDQVVSHADVIAVVRSTNRDLEDNAARGPEVELIAPGVNVFSTNSGNQYGMWTGTSFAAPCAAGCAALALSVAPDMTRNQLRTVMHNSADKIGGVVYDAAGHNDDYGFGRVNAARAVRAASELSGASGAGGLAVSWGANRLDVFGVGTDNAMYHQWWDGNVWGPSINSWERHDGVLVSPPTVVSWGANRLDVFGVGTDNAMYHQWWDGNVWGPSINSWERHDGVLVSPPTVVSWGANRLDVFGVGTDNAMYHQWWDGNVWGPSINSWERHDGALVSPPTVVSWGANRLDVFGVGTDNAMYHQWWDGNVWGPSINSWERHDGALVSPPTVVSWGANRLDVFGVGTDNAMYHQWWDGNVWGPSINSWERHDGVLVSPPTVVSWGANRLDVFGVGTDNAMYHQWWDGNVWGPSINSWERHDGALVSPPTVVSWGANRLDVFGVGTDNAMYHQWWDGNVWGPSLNSWERHDGVLITR